MGQALMAAVEALDPTAPTLKLSRSLMAPNEKFTVTFRGKGTWSADAWVGIVPKHIQHGNEQVNYNNQLSYQFLRQQTQGTLVFTAPAEEGEYDVRLHSAQGNGDEVYSETFVVGSLNEQFIKMVKL